MAISVRALAGAMALTAMGAASAGVGTWTTAGPHGGRISEVAISPLSPNNTYLTVGRGGLFRTTNGGGSWTRAEAGLPANLSIFAMDAATSGTSAAYALTGGAGVVYRSADFGLSWFALPAPWAGVAFPADLDVGPGDGSRVAVVTGDSAYVSTNNGSSWTTSAAGSFPSGPMVYVAIAANGDVYAAANSFDPAGYGLQMVRKSTDGGATWAAAGSLPDTDPSPGVSPLISFLRELATAPSDADRLYAAGGGLATSGDGGANWSEVAVPASCFPNTVDVSPASSVAVWVQCSSGTLLRTDDASVAVPTWVAMDPITNNYTINGTDPAQAAALALHPAYPVTPHIVAGTEYGGILRSTNNGGLWIERNDGLESTTIRALATHPRDSSVVLAGFGDAFSTSVPLYLSADGGASWANSSLGLNAEQIRALAIDPTTVDANPLTAESFHVYGVGRSAPIPDASALDGGIYKSTTSGNSWSTIDSGIATSSFFTPGGPVMRPFMGTVRSVVLDPRSCDSPPVSGPCPAVVPPTAASTLKTVLVGGSGRLTRSSTMPLSCPDTVVASRIYRSTNAGATWVASDSGIPTGEDLNPGTPGEQCVQIGGVVPLVIDPNNPLVLYAGTFLTVFDPSFPAEPTINNGVFKSTDGGLTWTHSSNGLPRVGGAASSHWDVLSFAIAPGNSNRLYATAINFDLSAAGRVYRSNDAGATWVRADSGIAGSDVRALLVDPDDPTGDTLFAGAGGSAANPGGVYRSTDGGLTWNSYSIGLQADAALALAIPDRPLGSPFRLFAGTVSGTWEFTEAADPDGDGAPTPVEAQSPGPTTGDGNGDGMPDAGQASVASNTGSVFEIAGGAGLAGKGAGTAVDFTVSISEGSCAQINNSQLVDPGFLPIDPLNSLVSYPQGAIRFELPNCAQAQIEVIFHGGTFNPRDWRWRNFGPTIPGDDATFAWYDLGARAEQVATNRWRLTLDAGQFGVYRSSGDNILLLGGPAFLPAEVFLNGFE